jgi:hypothetical protein
MLRSICVRCLELFRYFDFDVCFAFFACETRLACLGSLVRDLLLLALALVLASDEGFDPEEILFELCRGMETIWRRRLGWLQ